MAAPTPICGDCFRRLTPDERHYYENRCEECERIKALRYSRWLSGGSDPELDQMFGAEKPVKPVSH